MRERTTSEALFEQFCADAAIPISRIEADPSPSSPKTADYTIQGANALTIVVEVKQINTSPDEGATLLRLENPDEPAISLEPGARVRPMIDEAVPQLKATARQLHPTMLVAFDNTGSPLGRLSGYEVKAAMFGLEQAVIAVPRDHSRDPFLAAHRFGPKRKTSPRHNTTLGAVAILAIEHGRAVLRVFHNHHARRPIPPNELRHPNIRHFRLRIQEPEGTFSDWLEIRQDADA